MKPDPSKIVVFFNNLNDQTRYSALALVVILIILLDVFFLVSPQLAVIAGVNDQITKLSENTQQVIVDRGRTIVIKKSLQASQNQLNALSDKVRSIQEVPAILSTISSIANEYNVKIDELVPQKDRQEVLGTVADGKYYALPVIIKARCGYHMWGHFLNKLENENLCFFLNDFIIQNDDQNSNLHLFSLTIKIILVDRGRAPPKNL